MSIRLPWLLFLFLTSLLSLVAATATADPLITGEAALARGDRLAAQRALTAALAQAETPQQRARAALGLARWHLRVGDLAAAQSDLQQATQAAGADPGLQAAIADTQARLAILQDDPQTAQAAFRRALAQAEQAQDPPLALGIRLNRLYLDSAAARSRGELTAIARQITALPPEVTRWRLQLELARLAQVAAPELARRQVLPLLERPELPARLASQARATLAQLDQAAGQPAHALRWADTALAALSTTEAPEQRFPLEWQRAQLLQTLHQPQAALQAYRHAIGHLERSRADLPERNLDGSRLFTHTLAPLYRGYANVLLRQAAQAPEPQAQRLRRDAQDAIEAYRAAELQDYFKNACAVTRRRLATLDRGTAVLYPVVLPDRLELLLGLGARIDQATRPITQDQLAVQTREVADSLRLDQQLSPFDRTAAAQLYNWLLAPFEQTLRANAIDTLIFIPDGVLRTLPLAALWDGEAFVIERQAVVTAPGLSLLDSGRAPGGRPRALLAGLSEPGPVVEELPGWMVEAYGAPVASRSEPTTRGLNLRALETSTARAPTDERTLARVQSALALPGVAREIEQADPERLPDRRGRRTLATGPDRRGHSVRRARGTRLLVAGVG